MLGATLSKGLLRGLGTILGGGLGCLAAVLADNLGKIGNAAVVGVSVFIFGKAKYHQEFQHRIFPIKTKPHDRYICEHSSF